MAAMDSIPNAEGVPMPMRKVRPAATAHTASAKAAPTRLAEGEASRPAFCLSVVVRGGFTRSFRAIGDSGFLRQHLIGLVHQALLSTLMPRCVPPANDRYVFEGQRYSQMPQPLQRVESTMGRPDASAESAS